MKKRNNSTLIYQNENGEYLPDYSQPQFDGGYINKIYEKTRYINVDLGSNGIAKRLDSNNNLIEQQRQLPDLYSDTSKCCGCTACYSVCPKSNENFNEGNGLSIMVGSKDNPEIYKQTGAITMLPNEEGFLFPVVDAQLCIRCYKCCDVCDFK